MRVYACRESGYALDGGDEDEDEDVLLCVLSGLW